jgi:PAS domain S-box-containing protein
VHCRLHARAERAADGSVTTALLTAHDVTSLRETQRSLHDSRDQRRTLAENAGDQIARWDSAGRFVYANPRMVDLIGLPAEQIYGRTTMDVTHEDFDEVAAAVGRVLTRGAAELVEQPFVDHRDGHEHIHQVLCVPEHGDDGTLLGVLGVGRDITDGVRSREELERIARTDLLTGVPNS